MTDAERLELIAAELSTYYNEKHEFEPGEVEEDQNGIPWIYCKGCGQLASNEIHFQGGTQLDYQHQ